jgi:protein SCO1/2
MKKLKSNFLFVVVYVFIISCNNTKTLPFYGQREAKITTDKDGNQKIDTVYQTIPDFEFLNQDSVLINQNTFKDKIYIADFFFTSCSTICPTMHRNLKTVYDEYLTNSEVLFLSHTIDFKYDKPSVLNNYANKLGLDTKKWQFVYGSKDQIYKLATESYLVVVEEDNKAKDGYVHQGWLVLIDKQKRIRGAYDGTKTEQVEQLKKDVAILLTEK